MAEKPKLQETGKKFHMNAYFILLTKKQTTTKNKNNSKLKPRTLDIKPL